VEGAAAAVAPTVRRPSRRGATILGRDRCFLAFHRLATMTCMQRRTILKFLTGMGVLVASGLAALGAVFAISSSRWRKTGEPPWVPLCSVEEIPDAEPLARSFRFQRMEGWYWQEVERLLYVTRLSTGEPVVFSRTCTHLGCPITWKEISGTYRCPCHNGVFSREGEVLGGPPPRGLTRVPHRLSGTVVEVQQA